MGIKSKYKNQRRHAKQRFSERHGFDLTDDDLDYLRGCIKKNRNAKFCFKQSNTITHWEIEYKGRTLRVVYDKGTHTIVTVLPPVGMME